LRLFKSGNVELLAVVADTHCNSTIGLCPRRVPLDDGGEYCASDAQRATLRAWGRFWDRAETLKAEYKTRLTVVVDGDALDHPKHATTQVASWNRADILRLTAEIYDHPRQLGGAFYVLRGTEAHTGGNGELEELLADDLDATRDEKTGLASWWWLPLEIGGVTFDIAHHPQTSSRRPWTRGSAAARQAAITWAEYCLAGKKPPDVVLRGHAHYFGDSGTTLPTRCFFLPPWQITTAFGHRLGAGGMVEPVGGMFFLCAGGEYHPLPLRFAPKVRAPVRVPV